jgi:hypothetical protein
MTVQDSNGLVYVSYLNGVDGEGRDGDDDVGRSFDRRRRSVKARARREFVEIPRSAELV